MSQDIYEMIVAEGARDEEYESTTERNVFPRDETFAMSLRSAIDSAPALPDQILKGIDHGWHNKPHLFVGAYRDEIERIIEKFPGQALRILGSPILSYLRLLNAILHGGEKLPVRILRGSWENGDPITIPTAWFALDALQDACEFEAYSADSVAEFAEILGKLIANGCPVNDWSSDGFDIFMSALYDASLADRVKHMQILPVLKVLHRYGARPDLRSPAEYIGGGSAMHFFIEKMDFPVDVAVFRALLDSPLALNLDVPDEYGCSILHRSLLKHIPIEIAEIIMDREELQRRVMGIQPSLIVKRISYPYLLQLAEFGDHPQFENLVDLLIQRGADPKVMINAEGPPPRYVDGRLQFFDTEPLIDVILKNKNGRFNHRVTAYFERKKHA